MRYTATEGTYLLSKFSTGDSITITVYKVSSEASEALDSAACNEIGSTGVFEWNSSNLTTQPTAFTEYLWVMTDGTIEQYGKLVLGGYPARVEESVFEGGAVWIDADNGSSGTTYPTGTKLNPVDNYTDAKAIADVYGIKNFYVKGAIIIGAGESVAGLTFIANGNHAGMTFNGSSTLYTVVKGHMHISGTLNGHVHFHSAHFLSTTTGLEGFFESCLFEADNYTLGGSSLVRFINCSSSGAPGSNVVIDVNGSTATLGIWGYTGSIEIENKTGAGTFDIELLSGKLTIAVSCDNGKINVRGMGELEDNSAAGCSIVKGGLLTQAIEEQLQSWLTMIEQIHKVETGRWKITNNQMIFYDDDGTTPLYTFNLKDADGNATEQNVFERIIA